MHDFGLVEGKVVEKEKHLIDFCRISSYVHAG